MYSKIPSIAQRTPLLIRYCQFPNAGGWYVVVAQY